MRRMQIQEGEYSNDLITFSLEHDWSDWHLAGTALHLTNRSLYPVVHYTLNLIFSSCGWDNVISFTNTYLLLPSLFSIIISQELILISSAI